MNGAAVRVRGRRSGSAAPPLRVALFQMERGVPAASSDIAAVGAFLGALLLMSGASSRAAEVAVGSQVALLSAALLVF